MANKAAVIAALAVETPPEDETETYADREWRRFLSVAIPTPNGRGLFDPTAWPSRRPEWLDGLMNGPDTTEEN